MEASRVLKHVVLHCPECDQPHDVMLSVRAEPVTGDRPRLLFGGTASATTVVCPATKQPFDIAPRLADGEVVIGARVADDETEGAVDGHVLNASGAAAAGAVTATTRFPETNGQAPARSSGSSGSSGSSDGQEDDIVAQEFDAWTRSSRERALTFCAQMLTASSGSVAVYFAVLAFVGSKDVSSTGLGWFAVVPPLLFLAAVVSFALALAPKLAPVSKAEFVRFRAERLMHVARWLRAGLVLFVSAVGLALVIFALAMRH